MDLEFVAALVQRKLGVDCRAMDVTKNNGIVKKGVAVEVRKSPRAEAVFYLDNCPDMTEEAAAGWITSQMQHVALPEEIAPTDAKNLLAHVRPTLVAPQEDKTIPHKEFLDLWIVYQCFYKEDTTTVLVTRKLLEETGLSEEEVESAAMAHQSSMSLPMGNVLAMLTGQEEDVPSIPELYVLTSVANAGYGAAAMLDTKTLSDLADQLDGDLIILPSSVHEVLALKATPGKIDAMKGIVKMMNESEVQPEDVLSDSVYFFSREAKEVTIAA